MKTRIIPGTLGVEHPSVKRVLEIAEEILRKNKVLNIEKLYNLAKNRLKIPRNGLLSIIQFLINKKILIEGSKFSKETVLSNHIRNRIYNYIRIHPGVHFSILRKKALPEETGSSGQLIWHLELLLKFNYIRKIKVGHYTVFLPNDMDEETGRVLFILRDQINYKLIRLLCEKEFIIKSEVYKELNEKREDVYYRVNNLLEYNIITESSEKNIQINPSIKEVFFQVIFMKINIEEI
ncbi:MAG: hypothetical protein ACFFG0_45210 [Candidatus Thorarchaeota archaeon]